MNGWFLLSAVAAVGIAFMASYKLLWHFGLFKVTERLGLSLMAGSALMSIPPVLMTVPTPFDEWAGAVLRVGVFLYLAGKVVRLRKHDRNNEKLIEMAAEHRAERRRAS